MPVSSLATTSHHRAVLFSSPSLSLSQSTHNNLSLSRSLSPFCSLETKKSNNQCDNIFVPQDRKPTQQIHYAGSSLGDGGGYGGNTPARKNTNTRINAYTYTRINASAPMRASGGGRGGVGGGVYSQQRS